MLIGKTEGIIKNNFTLDLIKAITYSFKEKLIKKLIINKIKWN